jgi:NADH-quinone oxidoreductase subunit M
MNLKSRHAGAPAAGRVWGPRGALVLALALAPVAVARAAAADEPPPAAPATAAALPGNTVELGAAPPAGAEVSAAPAPRAVLSATSVDLSTAVPVADHVDYTGTLRIRNEGTTALNVTRVEVAIDPAEATADGHALDKGVTRRPTTLVLDPDPGAFVLAPLEERVVTLRLTPGDARQVFSFVQFQTDDPETPRLSAKVAWHETHWLSLAIFSPLAGLLLIVLLPLALGKRFTDDMVRWLAVAVTTVPLVVAVYLFWQFDRGYGVATGSYGLQWVEHGVWIPRFNIEFYLGVDGTNVLMVLLTAFISWIAVFASWGITDKVKGYFAMFLLLEVGMLGTFVALDFFLFYVFWEVMLLPMYFLIGIWGGPNRSYAAIKFFLYTLAGSVLMLLAIIAMYYNTNPSFLVDGQVATHTFNVIEMTYHNDFSKALIGGMQLSHLAWVGLFLGFCIKIPMFPFHTWLPDAHVEAPTPISVILAAVLLKMGTYGILRFNFAALPDATHWAIDFVALFGVINIVYGAFAAMAQIMIDKKDLKKLVAYSSVSHMGYVMLGMAALTPEGMNGAMFQMWNHGLISGMLFLCVGVIYDRTHTRNVDNFGGLAAEMPVYAAVFGLALMANLGLPGLAGFISEALVFLGAFPVYTTYTVLAAVAVIVTAAYCLWALQKMFLGKFNEQWKGHVPEINGRELLTLVPLGVLVILLGFWPVPILNMINTGMADLILQVQSALPVATAVTSAVGG